tara:strand:+ start:176 stop:1414 length:1239 start_codon:yes stop_codon:yes gene_type:complete
MANITIWDGSATFTSGSSTPLGFYDDDLEFQNDAPNVAKWCAQRLGYPLVDIELRDVNFFTAFEEAVSEYGHQIYTFQIKDNLARLRGSVTASSDGSWTDINQVNIDQDYGSLFEGGGLSGDSSYDDGGSYQSATTRKMSASLSVKKGVQRYDLITSDLVTWETSSDEIRSGSKSVKIKKIYHYQPAAINRYFDPYAGTGTGIQSLMQTFGMGNYSPGVNFMLMPMYFDVLKLQAIELNDTIRKSAYHFEIEKDRYLRLFPIPTSDYKLWFDYTVDVSDLGAGTDSNDVDLGPARRDIVTDMSNVPYTRPTYSYINEPGRQWIRRYALAICKEMLGSIRGKYQSLPIPGAETTLDYSRLLSEAVAEKEALITQLREDLGALTTRGQYEQIQAENEAKSGAQAAEGRYQIYIH